jgi:Ca2+-transporting ATPase
MNPVRQRSIGMPVVRDQSVGVDTLLARHWHHLSRDDVVTLLETDDRKGLDTFEVAHRQARFGPNRLTTRQRETPLIVLLRQFRQPLVWILLGAAVITFALGEWVDSGVILGVVLVNAAVGYVQESRALAAIAALARTMEGAATVIRAGATMRISAAELVPGDLVLLQSGDRVPADLRLLRTREPQLDESALTGESVPASKQPAHVDCETVLAERSNMAYSSTLVTYGAAAGVVVATGDGTEIGRISALIAAADVLATPLTRKIARFSSVLLWLILGLTGLTLLAGWYHGESLLDSFMAAVALAVGAIPEGLPAALTITLAIGVSRMARRHAIIRRLPAVETLGSTTVICADKTGTLTRNQMTVQQVFAGGRRFHLLGTGYAPLGEIRLDGVTIDSREHPALAECLQAGLLCNEARLVCEQENWRIEGDPTEAALLTAAAKAGLSAASLAAGLPRIDTLHFESQHQYMATLHRGAMQPASVIYVKGAVERVLSRCRDQLAAGGATELLDVEAICAEMEAMAERGLRVLALARKAAAVAATTVTHADVAEGLTFLGLQAMMDPPRPEAIAAVRACRQAGIEVKMITGDHLVTAAAIARQLGLEGAVDGNAGSFALGGHALASLSDRELVDAASRVTVFARVAPEQKLRLVEALQAAGHVVAMTGDGVNDAPALKRADIGIAMGAGGTEVAKEAAAMVLTDDNFATIEAAVEEGRAVFDNLVKFITWTLPTNVGEGLVIMVAVFAGVTLPITPLQILWINMTTAVLLGLMLAFEQKEPALMQRPPRRPDTPVLTGELSFRIGLVSVLLTLGAFGLFEWALQAGRSVEVARTIAVNTFVFGEIFYLFNCRSLRRSMFSLGVFSNRWLLVGVALMVLLQLLFTYTASMNEVFGSAPVGSTAWLLILASSLSIYMLVGVEKWVRGRVGGA